MFKKFIRIIAIMSFYLLVFFPINTVISSHSNFDLLNLSEQVVGIVDAYFKISLGEAWNEINILQLNFAPATIGILDSGTDTNHPEFSGVSLGSTPPGAKTDRDPDGHGTQIAGIIGANNISFPNSTDYQFPQMNGVLSGAHNLSYTLEIRKTSELATLFNARRQLQDIVDSGARVVNISLSSFRNTFRNFVPARIFEAIFNNDPSVLFIVAAGNDNGDANDNTPANLGDDLDNVITVGATTLNDIRVPISNFGNAVNIAAPGDQVYAPKPFTPPLDPTDYDPNFTDTSASAPMVTGVVGLLKAIKPELTPAQIKQILVETADPIQTGEPDKRIGTGCYANPNDPINTGCRLNALEAVKAALPAPPPPTAAPIWPMIKFDAQNSGLAPVVGPPFTTSADVEIKWQKTIGIGGGVFPPLIDSQGRVYAAVDSLIVATSSIFALDGETGNVLLEINTVPGNVNSGAIGPDSTIYVCSNGNIQGTLSAFDPTDGHKKWDFVVGGPRPCLGPVVSKDGIVYTSVPPPLNAQTVVMVAINPDGTERWRYEETNVAASVPALSHDETQVYVVFSKQALPLNDHLMAFDAKATTTTILWDVPSGNSFTTLKTVVDPLDRVLIHNLASPFFHTGNIRAFSKDGDFLWLSPNIGEQASTAITPQGDIAVISGPTGQLSILNPLNGTVSVSTILPTPTNPDLTVDQNGTFYSQILTGGAFGPGITAFDISGLIWLFSPTFLQAPSILSIGQDGTLYTKVGDTVYALNNIIP